MYLHGENIRLHKIDIHLALSIFLPITRLNDDHYIYFGSLLSRANGQLSTIVIVGIIVSTAMELTVTQLVDVKVKAAVLSAFS